MTTLFSKPAYEWVEILIGSKMLGDLLKSGMITQVDCDHVDREGVRLLEIRIKHVHAEELAIFYVNQHLQCGMEMDGIFGPTLDLQSRRFTGGAFGPFVRRMIQPPPKAPRMYPGPKIIRNGKRVE